MSNRVHPAEIALLAVTITAVVGMSRLFSNASFLPPVLLAALVGHAAAYAGRRLGLHPLAAAGLSVGGLALTVAWVVEPHTTTFGIPTFATVDAVRADLATAWQRFGEVVAPTASTRGFVLASVIGAWLTATVADGFAFRGRARFEALVPSFTVFLFGAMLGADRFRIGLSAAYFAALVAFVLLSDAAGRDRGPAWFGRRAVEGERSLLRTGAAMALAVVVAAVVVGPRLPGADARGLLAWRDADEGPDGPRVTVSPLVDIRGRLVGQSDVELFTVASEVPSYWRLTSLDQFDGAIWSSRGTYQRARGELRPAAPSRAAADTVRQDFVIGALSSIWLPAAFRPERVRSSADPVRYDRDSASLLTDGLSSDNLSYSVESELPRPTAEELAPVPAVVPDDIAERYLALPPQVSPTLVQTAARQTEGRTTPYAKAKALQDWFRTEFAYTLEVTPGHSSGAIDRFLRERKGYCEQFAGTFAAMARALGIPARVAVGFTAGELRNGRYSVLGRNAHAWPEVYLAGYGWVPFEPTPGRSIPGAEGYTGVPPQAAEDDQTVPPAAPPTTVPETPSDRPVPEEIPEETAADPETNAPDSGGRLLVWVLAAGVVVSLAMAAVPVARAARRRRRRELARTPSDRVLVAWQEAEEALAAAGRGQHPWETAGEYARRVGSQAGGAPLARLADDTSVASWSEDGVAPEVAARAGQAAAEVRAEVAEAAGPGRRVLWALDPRPLWQRRDRRPSPDDERRTVATVR